MAYVILQQCCNDASCVAVCPVDCIHPRPDEAGFMRAEMLHIDPQTCIDCGACVDECPVDAIKSDDELESYEEPYRNLNADYFIDNPIDPDAFALPTLSRVDGDVSDLRVAVVGSGPSAFYSALELEAMNGPHVEMFERLYTPFGLVRFGVAPDHQSTKSVTDVFRTLERRPTFRLNLGVEIGNHIMHEELLKYHHAVVYAVGGSSDWRLGVSGESLPGSHAATEFVSWYNGHPDYADRNFDLSCERAVIIGNGNVALDVARILLADPDYLAATDIADHALEALRNSNIREVVLVGRRGVAQASYTNPEMMALCNLPGVEIVVEGAEPADQNTLELSQGVDADSQARFKVDFIKTVATRENQTQPRRLVLRYLAAPIEILGPERVTGVRLVQNQLETGEDGSVKPVATDEVENVATGLVLRSVGYRGSEIPGVPFDERQGLIPNDEGRVRDPDTGQAVPGVYVTGWIKRGASGVIGTNKKCAADTVKLLIQDYLDSKLTTPLADAESLATLVSTRQPSVANFEDWSRLDRAERNAGRANCRPRVKFVDQNSMRDALRASV